MQSVIITPQPPPPYPFQALEQIERPTILHPVRPTPLCARKQALKPPVQVLPLLFLIDIRSMEIYYRFFPIRHRDGDLSHWEFLWRGCSFCAWGWCTRRSSWQRKTNPGLCTKHSSPTRSPKPPVRKLIWWRLSSKLLWRVPKFTAYLGIFKSRSLQFSRNGRKSLSCVISILNPFGKQRLGSV